MIAHTQPRQRKRRKGEKEEEKKGGRENSRKMRRMKLGPPALIGASSEALLDSKRTWRTTNDLAW